MRSDDGCLDVKKSRIGGPARRFFVVFTDLDGTLLDADSYRWDDAAPALKLCRCRHIPVIMVSSKTRAEMEVIHSQLALSDPFVAENGGGIFFPPESSLNPPPGSFLDKGLWKWSLGIPYHQLTKALHDIIAELGWNARGFSQMDIQEVSHLTGLGLETSRLAAMREYDEPFLILAPERPELGLLHASAAQRGLKVSVGGRFCHLQGQNDKGVAMQRLLAMYRRTHRGVLSIALGDSQNGFSMLEGADYPVLVRSEKNFGTLEMDNPRLVVTRKPGPAGWNTAIMDILGEEEGE